MSGEDAELSPPVAAPGTDEDRRLMAAVAARDAAALKALYDRHSPIVFGICLRILRDRDEAEQTLVDVFAELWNDAPRFDASRGSLKNYLALLARSRSIDLARKRKSAARVGTGLGGTPSPDGVKTPNDLATEHTGDLIALDTERRDIVGAALASLPPEQRDVIALAFFDGLSHQEVADKLERPLGTVKGQIRTGLSRLRDRLSRYWEGGSRDAVQ